MAPLFSINPKKSNTKLPFVQLGFILFALIIIVKLVDLQLIDPQHLQDKAKKMRQAKAFIFRGEIVDRNGVKLATDSTLYDMYAHPQYYDEEKLPPEKMSELLSPFVKIPKEELTEKLKKKYSTITVVKGLDRTTALQIMKFNIRGIDLAKRNVRVYPQNNLASHILGYVNPDADISAGVENTGSTRVKTAKESFYEKNGRGDLIFDFNTDPEVASKPIMGEKLVLTIDSDVQHIAETELKKMVDKTKADRGTVIVMNPNNGEILAFAVLPTYNPNNYNKFNFSVVKNWVLSDVYPPGSTFKVLTVASAMENKKIDKYTRILDTGKIKVQGWTIENYDYSKRPYPGDIGLDYLFEHSSNVGSVKVAFKMTKDEFYNQLVKFGIGSKTGIDLPGESQGVLPPTSTWDLSRQATLAFGYSLAATPIQMIDAVASIANGGYLVTPHVIKYNEEESLKRLKKVQVLSPETCRDMTELLEGSIRRSKSGAGQIPNFTVAGKTGTSRKPNPYGPGYLKDSVFTSLVGYFPSKKPQIIMMVVVDNPKGGGVWGSTIAGPVFNEIATQITRIYAMKPDAPGLNVKSKI